MSTTHENSVLIVEDEPSIAETTRYLLEASGYEVETAATGTQALALVRERRPRLVLLDVELPDLSGIEICSAIRNDPELRSTRVVFLTTHDMTHISSTAPGLEPDGHLRKPLDIDLLLDTVAGFVRAAGEHRTGAPASA
jgi:CheY-like chemotaxis protein